MQTPNIKNYSYWNFNSLFRRILWCGILKQNPEWVILYSELLGFFTWELGWWPSGKNTLVMTMSPVERVCVSQSTMTGLTWGCGLGVDRLVAAERMFSSFSILSILVDMKVYDCIETWHLSLPVKIPIGQNLVHHLHGLGQTDGAAAWYCQDISPLVWLSQ